MAPMGPMGGIGQIRSVRSRVLAISSIAVAQVHHFPYYDPLLLTIFRWGAILSLGGIAFGIGGVLRRSSLRWHAPVSAVGTLAFWLVAIWGE